MAKVTTVQRLLTQSTYDWATLQAFREVCRRLWDVQPLVFIGTRPGDGCLGVVGISEAPMSGDQVEQIVLDAADYIDLCKLQLAAEAAARREAGEGSVNPA